MTTIEKKTAELELYNFLYDLLQDEDHIYFSDLQKKLECEKPLIFKYFQCEYCIKASIAKFPDCFYVSKLKDTVLLTSVANVRKDYYSHYMNSALTGSVVTEVFTLCRSLIAKLELYKYLVEKLKINRVIVLDSVLAEIATYSEYCKQYFKCKHAIIEALKQVSCAFQINQTDSVKHVAEISTSCVLDFENFLGTIFSSDDLLDLVVTTYIQLAAELELYSLTKRRTVPPSCIQATELVEIVLKNSTSCCEYMPSCAKIKTVLSLFPDIFYISKRNRILQRQSVNIPAEDWYDSDRPGIVFFDELLFKLKEVCLKDLGTLKLVEITKAQLKEHKHVSLADITSTIRQNNYCRKYFHDLSVVKNALSSFSGLFHISRQKNVLLLESEWQNPNIRQMHDTVSDSVLSVVIRSCEAILSEIHVYSFLIYQYCYILKKDQSISLEVMLKGITSNEPICKQIFTSVEQLKNSIQNYPSQFKINAGNQVCFILGRNKDSLSTYSASPCSSAGIQFSDGILTLCGEERIKVPDIKNSCKNKKFLIYITSRC